MNQIIMIKEIKGFSRVGQRWGEVGGGRPAQERRRGHSVRDGVVGGEPSGEVLEGCHKTSGVRVLRPRTGRSPGAPEARRARVFVSLIFFEASPTPSAVPSLTSNNLLASPGLCFPGGHRLRDAGQPPRALVGPASDTPSGPRPLPARRQGSKAARVTWSPSSTESAGRAEGESGWKPRNPASIAAPGPAPAPAPGRSPHASRPPGLRRRSPAGTHAPSRDRTPLPRPRFGEVGTAAGEGKGRRAGGPGRAGSPLCAPPGCGAHGSAPQLPVFGETPTSSPRERGAGWGARGGTASCPSAVQGAGTGGWAPGGRGRGTASGRRSGRWRRLRRGAGVGAAGGGGRGVNPGRGQSPAAPARPGENPGVPRLSGSASSPGGRPSLGR